MTDPNPIIDPNQQNQPIPEPQNQSQADAGTTQTQGDDSQQSSQGGGSPQGDQGNSAGSGAEDYDIPEEVKEKYQDLVDLIIQTESMNDDERNYWFQTLPIMSEDQVETLRNILETEKKKLEELDNKYQEEISKINAQQMSEWKTFEHQEKTKVRKEAETQARIEEDQSADDALKELEDL